MSEWMIYATWPLPAWWMLVAFVFGLWIGKRRKTVVHRAGGGTGALGLIAVLAAIAYLTWYAGWWSPRSMGWDWRIWR